MSRITIAVVPVLALAITGCASTPRPFGPNANRNAHDLTESHLVGDMTPITNHDVIQMKRAGISDDLVLATIRDRGGEFDLSPDGIIQLSKSNVPDKLITSIQDMGDSKPDVVQASATTTEWADPPPRSPSVVVVTPLGPVHRPRLHRCRPPRRSGRVSFGFAKHFCFD